MEEKIHFDPEDPPGTNILCVRDRNLIHTYFNKYKYVYVNFFSYI